MCCHIVRPAHTITAAITVVTLVTGTAATGLQDHTNPYKVMTMSTWANCWLLKSPWPTCRSFPCPLLTIPYIQYNFARWFFCFTSPTGWNSLPVNILSSHIAGYLQVNTEGTSVQRCFLRTTLVMSCNVLRASESMELACYKLVYYYYYYYYFLKPTSTKPPAGMKIKLSKNNDHDGILLGVKSA